MKKRFALLISILLLVSTALVSCQLPFGNNTNTGGGGEEPDNLIYDADSELFVIMGEGALDDDVINIVNSIDKKKTVPVQYASPTSEAHKHEIVVGNTDREISKTALSRLQRLNKESGDISYLIYSDGSSLAIVYDEEDNDVAQKWALEYFAENLVKDSLTLSSGVVTSRSFDVIEEYYRVLDEEHKLSQWENMLKSLDPAYAEEFVEALKQLYAVFTPDVVTWLANLYDPDICICYGLYGKTECEGTKYCGTGAFYYSNSGRDTLGYLPDAESTSQGLGFLDSSGMSYRFGNYKNWLPEDMKQKMGAFAKALQEENGYFYHPQWSREFIDTKLSRRARDLGHCVSLLTLAGMKPIYNTPSGVTGEGEVDDVALTDLLGRSKASLVSKVVATEGESATNYPLHMETVDAFQKYLNSKDIRYKSYSVGNEIGSQVSQIVARDKTIGTEDDPTPLMDTLIKWLNANQNPKTGCWDWAEQPEAYEAVNGLLKIGGIYTTAGEVMPYAREAATTAMIAITNPTRIDVVTDLYNTWYSIQNTVKNLRQCGGAAEEALADEIVHDLRAMAIDGLIVSRDKIAAFKKADGSFSYAEMYSSSTSQGCQVAVPKSVEGDVNATVISVNGIIGHALGALELSNLRPILFGEAERRIYLNAVQNANPVVKQIDDSVNEKVTFDDDDVGEESELLTYSFGGGSATVIENPNGSGNVCEILSHTGAGDYVYVPNVTNSAIAETFVFEGEFFVDRCNLEGDEFCQILMGSCYRFVLTVNEGKIYATETSHSKYDVSKSESLGVVGTVGEWFKLKIEYYYGTHDTVRIKFYSDSDLSDSEGERVIAVSDNYYDHASNKFKLGEGTPSKSFDRTSIFFMKDSEVRMLMDNVSSYKVRSTYLQEKDPANQPPINIDPPDSAEKKYEFTDSIPSDFTVVGGEEAFSVSDGALAIDAAGSEVTPEIKLPINVRTINCWCAELSFDVTVSGAEIGEKVLLIKNLDAALEVYGIVLVAESDDLGDYVAMYEYVNGAIGEIIENVRIPVGEKTSISLQYYHKQDMVIIYVNGVFVAATSQLCSNGYKATVDSLSISATPASAADVLIDDLIFEKNDKLFIDAVAPSVPSSTHDFEEQDDEAVLSGSASYDGGKVKLLSNSGLTLPLKARSTIYNTVLLEAELKYAVSASGETHRIYLEDESGKVVFALALMVKDGQVGIYEVSEGGTLSYPLRTYPVSDTVKLSVEIFAGQRVAHIYESGVAMAKTSVFYNYDNILNDISTMRIVSTSARSTLTVDNVKIESYYASYVQATIKSQVNDEKDVSDIFTFESSNSGNIPASITKNLSSSGAALRVENMINDVREAWSNVLSFTTSTGSNDTLAYNTSQDMSGYSTYTFEADIRVDAEKTGANMYWIMFSQKLDRNRVYMLGMGADKSGALKITDCSNVSTASSKSNTASTDLAFGEWFNLRVEFYPGDRDTVKFVVYVNDEEALVSDNFYMSHIEGNSPQSTILEYVSFYSFSDTEATIYFDNVSITGSK